ncbi:MAG: prolyl-tRNA synthetase associated domain-containing protein [Gemmatimonadota bacterium]|nr:MAG: prolyl-tRNA synthetase associated domain-containing protein [Gemmatimonadota bacterium]
MNEACDRDKWLADGSAAAVPEHLFHRLRELGIEAPPVHHPPVFTVEEAKRLRGKIEGCHTKSLFLRNKKGNMWLVICTEDQQVDLKQLGNLLGAGRLSFCSADRLMKYLGLIPGAVSPFGVVNDKGGVVRVVLDRRMLEREPLNFHPLDNSMTSSISRDDLIRFLEAENHSPKVVSL